MNLMGIDMGTTSVKTAVFNELLEEKIKLCADYTLESHGDIIEFPAESYWDAQLTLTKNTTTLMQHKEKI